MHTDIQRWMTKHRVTIMDYLVEDIIKKVSTKVDYSEVYMNQSKSTEITLLNDKVNYAKEENITGLGLRVIKNQQQGFAYTTNITKVDEMIEQAIKNSKLNNPDKNISIIEKPEKYNKIKQLYDKNLEEVDLKEAIHSCEEMSKMVSDNACEVTSGEYGVTVDRTTIANSNGVNVSESQTGCVASISVNAEDVDGNSSAYSYDISHYNDLDFEKIVEESTTLALKSTNAKPTHTRDTKVVLDYFAAVSLLNPFMSALSSENTQRKRSYFQDKLNQQVSNESFSLYDDGTIPGANRSSTFDDEGSPTQKTELIKDGVLKNFIYDTYHANKEEKETTANAVRASYSSVPNVGFSNLKLEFSDINPIEEIQEGIIVNNVMGAHTANPITGDFSVEARNAFEIENGVITTPIKKAMISGNIFKIMEEATAATKETRQIGALITPKMLVNSLRVIA